jgi:hypothetical protein
MTVYLDHVQMQALAKTMGVNLSVAYLDGSAGTSEDGSVDFVKFENGGGNEANGIDDVVLLYRYVTSPYTFLFL